jgi:chromosome segregation ATPase
MAETAFKFPDEEIVNDKETASTEVEIEIVDDTPDQDKGRPRRPEGKEAEIPEDDEIAHYSEGVQKRIKKLRYEFHEERRAKEDASRQLNEATAFAKRLMDEKKRMEEALRKGEEILVENAKSKVESDLELVRKKFKEAYDAGDSDGLAAAQERMAELSVQKVSAVNSLSRSIPCRNDPDCYFELLSHAGLIQEHGVPHTLF